MRTDGLSFDHIPPLSAPMGFFLTAPLFGLVAAALLLLEPQSLQQRWQGSTLAITHLLSLGFGAHIMLGALYQVMPVVSSQPLPAAARLAVWVRALLSSGTLALVTAFLAQTPWLFGLAALTLSGAFILFLGSLSTALWRARPAGDTVRILRFAGFSLLIAVLLGLNQTLFHSLPLQLNYRPSLTELHLLWGPLGWICLLVIGVSLQVIPMFHVTPAFPRWVSRWLAPTMVVTLIGASLDESLRAPSYALFGLTLAIYALAALRLLQQRKRKLVDYTVRLWQLSLSQLLLFALGLLLCGVGFDASDLGLPMALVFALGFTLSVIVGMLQKIVPFLIYLHLQRACLSQPLAISTLPNMKTILPTARAKTQWQLQLLCLALLYTGLLFNLLQSPSTLLVQLGALALGVNFGWLGWSVWRALGIYRRALLALE